MSRVTLPTTRFTVDEFVRLVEADAFGTERVELLNGRMYFMTQRRPHLVAISKGMKALGPIVPDDHWLLCQGTMRFDRLSAPDPDFIWLPVPIDTPEHHWPQPIVLIEISDTTYRKDSGPKLRKYAFHGVPEYWIENLRERRVEVYREPRNPTGRERDCHYASVTHFVAGQTIELSQRPGVTVAVDALLP